MRATNTNNYNCENPFQSCLNNGFCDFGSLCGECMPRGSCQQFLGSLLREKIIALFPKRFPRTARFSPCWSHAWRKRQRSAARNPRPSTASNLRRQGVHPFRAPIQELPDPRRLQRERLRIRRWRGTGRCTGIPPNPKRYYNDSKRLMRA